MSATTGSITAIIRCSVFTSASASAPSSASTPSSAVSARSTCHVSSISTSCSRSMASFDATRSGTLLISLMLVLKLLVKS